MENNTGRKGLPNIGNSCYLNASIQLCKLISSFNFKDDNDIQNNFITDIQSVFQSEDEQFEINKYMRLYSFIANKLGYQIGEQQDSCEVLQFILDKYVDLIYDKDLLLSVFNQIVLCSNCNNYRICNEQSESMIISQELNNRPNEDIEFNHFLNRIIDVQDLENHNTECNCDSPRAQAKIIFTKLPTYLFIKVGRCRYDTTKLYNRLNFVKEFVIDHPFDLRQSIIGKDMRKIENHYTLIGVLIHHGNSSHSGHYASIVKTDDDWIYCDDMMVGKVNIDNDMEYIQKNCCVLLYHKD